MSQRAVITGAHGFLGRHVARALAAGGYVVTGIGHGNWDRDEAARYGVTFWHTADVALSELVTYAAEPDLIVHCAGSGSVAFSMTHPYQDFARTVFATTAVLEYVRLHTPRTVVVYPSSAAVYGAAERLPIGEGDRLNPASPYGMHKLMGEQQCRSYAQHFGISVAVVRFFSIYGEGLRKQLLWDACSRVARGEALFSGSGAELRDWLHVDDAAALLRTAALHASAECPVVNGGSGQGVRVDAVLAGLFSAYGSVLEPRFSGAVRPGDPLGYHAAIDAATAWGWQPKVELQNGLARYVDWFKRQQP